MIIDQVSTRSRPLRIGRLVLLLSQCLGPSNAMAQSADVDWKMFGGASLENRNSICFFDSKGVNKMANGQIQVWTKCLPQSEIDTIDTTIGNGKKAIEETATKIMNGYAPPMAIIDSHLDYDQIMGVITYEQFANSDLVKPESRILYQFDCDGRRLRELSILIEIDGKSGSIQEPRDWKYISPETNANRLFVLICRHS